MSDKTSYPARAAARLMCGDYVVARGFEHDPTATRGVVTATRCSYHDGSHLACEVNWGTDNPHPVPPPGFISGREFVRVDA